MASPVYQGVDRYGPTAYTFPGGGWPSSQTLSAPSFAASTYIVYLVADYIERTSTPPVTGVLDHWNVPASWTFIGNGGGGLFSGINNSIVGTAHVYQCTAAQIAGAFVRPETAANALYTPSVSSDGKYWRVFVVGFTPAKLVSGTANAGAGESRTTLPYLPPNPLVGGLNEGTWVQIAFGSFRQGGGPGTVNTANGWTVRFTETNFALVTKAFSATGSTPSHIWNKGAGAFAIGHTFTIVMDTYPPQGGVYLFSGLHLS